LNDLFVDTQKEGMASLRQLLGGKHLKPEMLALMVVVVAQDPAIAMEIILDVGRQARWEVANG